MTIKTRASGCLSYKRAFIAHVQTAVEFGVVGTHRGGGGGPVRCPSVQRSEQPMGVG